MNTTKICTYTMLICMAMLPLQAQQTVCTSCARPTIYENVNVHFIDDILKKDLVRAFAKHELQPFENIFVKNINKNIYTPFNIAKLIGAGISGTIPTMILCLIGYAITQDNNQHELIRTALITLGMLSFFPTSTLVTIHTYLKQRNKEYLRTFDRVLKEWQFFIDHITPQKYRKNLSRIHKQWYAKQSPIDDEDDHDYYDNETSAAYAKKLYRKEGIAFIKQIRSIIKKHKESIPTKSMPIADHQLVEDQLVDQQPVDSDDINHPDDQLHPTANNAGI